MREVGFERSTGGCGRALQHRRADGDELFAVKWSGECGGAVIGECD